VLHVSVPGFALVPHVGRDIEDPAYAGIAESSAPQTCDPQAYR